MTKSKKRPLCELWCDITEYRDVERAIHTVTREYPISIPSGRAGALLMIEGLDDQSARSLLRSVRNGVLPTTKGKPRCD